MTCLNVPLATRAERMREDIHGVFPVVNCVTGVNMESQVGVKKRKRVITDKVEQERIIREIYEVIV